MAVGGGILLLGVVCTAATDGGGEEHEWETEEAGKIDLNQFNRAGVLYKSGGPRELLTMMATILGDEPGGGEKL
jgi:hypothetical protein